jgi:glycine/D-amino acid oxidase-like deaminating enzyme
MEKVRVVVVGAGAFGGWTALELVRRGALVELIDAWGPGNARASSGGETRVIRATYGSHAIYTRMAIRALERWRDHDRRFQWSALHVTGSLWMSSQDDGFAEASRRSLADAGLAFETVTPRDAAARYPQIDFSGITEVFCEPEAGYLFASRACAQVAQQVVAEGGTYRVAAVRSPAALEDDGRALAIADGTRVEADAFVFACGPWLPSLFPDVLGSLITPTRQDVYYFGVPPGETRLSDPHLPVWLELGGRFFYGIPGAPERGFKIADDTPGRRVDPSVQERVPDPHGVSRAREYLARRFPLLADAPLIRAEVCQYESTPDANFIIDRHPAAPNVWIVGGGSGHGFKMGPAVGEIVADAVLGKSSPDPLFGVARFGSPPAGGWKKKWS